MNTTPLLGGARVGRSEPDLADIAPRQPIKMDLEAAQTRYLNLGSTYGFLNQTSRY